MKIIYKTGSLVEASETVIIHGCNARGKMNSGVAKAIRQAFPWAYDAYMYAYNNGGLQLGQIVWANSRNPWPVKTIGNVITQGNYGYTGKRYVSYDAIRWAICEIRDLVTLFGYIHAGVAMPMIGAGLGGGDWNTISEIIETESADVFQPVVYKLG